jgi:hypothetical protein
LENILGRLECFKPCPEAIDYVVQKMPGFGLEFEEKDEQFWAVLKFPDKEFEHG